MPSAPPFLRPLGQLHPHRQGQARSVPPGGGGAWTRRGAAHLGSIKVKSDLLNFSNVLANTRGLNSEDPHCSQLYFPNPKSWPGSQERTLREKSPHTVLRTGCALPGGHPQPLGRRLKQVSLPRARDLPRGHLRKPEGGVSITFHKSWATSLTQNRACLDHQFRCPGTFPSRPLSCVTKQNFKNSHWENVPEKN